MKKLIAFIFCVLIISIPVLYGINCFIEHFIKKQKEDIFGKVNELLDGNTAYNILCIGSSRTLVQVDPHVLDSVLSSNSYNAGLDGTTLIECNMLLNAYLQKHKPPSMVVLNIETNSLNIDDTTSIFNYPLYFPYLKNRFVYKTLSAHQAAVKLLTFFPFIRPAYYDDFKKYMALKAYMQPAGNKKNILYKGYEPKDLSWRGKKLDGYTTIDYTPKGVSLLNDFFATCRTNNITPVVVYAPQTAAITKTMKNFIPFKTKLHEWCAQENILFLDYSEIPLTKNEKYFYDNLHLNREGSSMYSLLLAEDLKKIVTR